MSDLSVQASSAIPGIYIRKYTLCSCDVDCRRRLRISSLLTMTQEAAIAHTRSLGAGRDKTLDRGYLWVIAMQRVQISRLPEYDEEVTLRSWPGKMMHAFFPRFFTLTDKEGGVLVHGSDLWLLMDQRSRQIVFPEDVGVSIEGTVTGDEAPLPCALKNLEGGISFLFTVPRSYIDLNGHMNNTCYPTLACDYMDETWQERTPCEIRMEYITESHLGDRLLLRLVPSEDGQSCHFYGRSAEEKGESEKPRFKLCFMYRFAATSSGDKPY